MINKSQLKVIMGVGLVLFATGIIMRRYFPLLHPQLAFVISSCSPAILTVGFLNLWRIRRSARKNVSKH
ncbi:hypothetical protein [Mucilaginibacter sp. OK283]|uniref:hypothetical protein n=1 Tax=Mucilaginibacter sp. OK283 TaxID=1881049 RepID=UPI000B855389|nr:hypothetical protein [Mucilaginibacter sp. OK283]